MKPEFCELAQTAQKPTKAGRERRSVLHGQVLAESVTGLDPDSFFTRLIGSLANRFIPGDVIDMLRSQNHVAANKL